jgi:purine-binding chemotaxis protein CheW
MWVMNSESNTENPQIRSATRAGAVARSSSISREENQKLLVSRAQILALKPAEEDNTADSLELTTFLLGKDVYAFDSNAIREICAVKTITPLPCTPSHVDGLIYLRGQIITLIDLQQYLGMQASLLVAESTAILAESQELQVGFRVDKVLDTISVSHSALGKSLKGLENVKVDYVLGITPDFVVVLDLNKMVSDEKLIVNQTV